ncbi:hypothetical protein GCM10009621_10170 [Corynebacterium felinum]
MLRRNIPIPHRNGTVSPTMQISQLSDHVIEVSVSNVWGGNFTSFGERITLKKITERVFMIMETASSQTGKSVRERIPATNALSS